MSKSIRSFPESERAEVIARRIKGDTKGLGFWGAINGRKHHTCTIVAHPTGCQCEAKTNETN